MANIVPTGALVRRLLPAIAVEFVALAACIVGFVLTGHLAWIFAAVVVIAVFAAWVVRTLVRHRSEWRWMVGTLSSSTGPLQGKR